MNIEFKNFKDEKPKHGDTIVYIHVSDFYSTFDFRFAQVEYSWDDLDGMQVFYEEGDEPPVDCPHLFIGFDQFYESVDSDRTLWWKNFDEIDELLEQNC
jgi:hypothetical protein